ncbi:hypothetical protein JOC95_000368 [Bacillus tianshenii]|uniref:Uncharacterized protein n=1 Tax=Sutcliffiella tianshenii TaxID=1463404 RepID=A0ABS2NV32_9BACI|nr:hypothetical protein [Bacillus tianshenii]MBM7618526.1 hypothetical protein [Bacillus tianshenii]
MQKHIKEEDLYQIKMTALDRLSPDGISVFFWGAFIYSAVIVGFSFQALTSPYLANAKWQGFTGMLFILLVIQALGTFFYSSEKIAYKYQKLQVLFLLFVSFKLSFEMYLPFFLLHQDRMAPSYIQTVGLVLMAGGLLTLILAVIHGFLSVRKGYFKRNEKGLYRFSTLKNYVGLPFLFGLLLFGGLLAKAAWDMPDVFSIGEVFFALFLSFVIQYAIALTWPEFLLLAYSKFKFKSFSPRFPNRKKGKLG